MQECGWDPYSTFPKAFPKHLDHLCCKRRLWVSDDWPRHSRLGNHAVGMLQTGVVVWSEAELLCVMAWWCSRGALHS